jgi:hypothetical protein
LGIVLIGYSLGARRTAKLINKQLDVARADRVQRWTPPPPQQSGDPGSPERLLSDYEDAVYAESRHGVAAQLGSGDEQDHVAIAAQLHADVRRLRGRVLAELSGATQI